ncbi:MAG: tRNA1(Val) (adenine(37)-N6)-methyltransferase [Lachnospiraceae bacterium]|nr:tRNA1(Val) (adenine(37)-N6)-methyltransferase [Lachnospiraceae bacterium]
METEKLRRNNERIDDLQRCGLKILQDPERFCFGMDAVLLSGFTGPRVGERLLDLGTGTGILPLLLSAKTGCKKLIGLEIQPESADMARRSVALNGLTERIEIVTGDIREAGALFAPASFDSITCNPPYMPAGEGLVNPEDAKAIARHEICCTFRDVAQASAKLLRPGGKLYLVHRPQRLAEILTEMSQCRIEPKRLRMVHPYADREPNMILIEGVSGGGRGMKVEKPLIVWEKQGVYTEEVAQLYGF